MSRKFEAEPIWIVEPCPTGHHFAYVSRLFDEADSVSLNAVLATSELAASSEEFAVHLSRTENIAKRTYTFRLDDSHGFWAILKSLRNLQRLAPRSATLLFPEADHVLLPWLFAGSRRRSTIFLLMRFDASSDSRSQRAKDLVARAVKWTGGRGVRVCKLVPTLSSQTDVTSWPVPVRDPAPRVKNHDRSECRVQLGLPLDRPICLVMGVLSARKSIPQLLDWVSKSPAHPRPLLVLAGRCDVDLRNDHVDVLLSELVSRGDVILRNSYIENEDFEKYYGAADAVAIMYENRGASGALAHAIASGVPVLSWAESDTSVYVESRCIGAISASRAPSDIQKAFDYVCTHRFDAEMALAQKELPSNFLVDLVGYPLNGRSEGVS